MWISSSGVVDFCFLFKFQPQHTHWPFSKSKFNLKSDRVNLVAPASPIQCLRFPNVRAILYKLGSERLTLLGNSTVLRLPVSMLLLCSLPKNGSAMIIFLPRLSAQPPANIEKNILGIFIIKPSYTFRADTRPCRYINYYYYHYCY